MNDDPLHKVPPPGDWTGPPGRPEKRDYHCGWCGCVDSSCGCRENQAAEARERRNG